MSVCDERTDSYFQDNNGLRTSFECNGLAILVVCAYATA